jgi:chloramphenicol O-acetyltransferase type A
MQAFSGKREKIDLDTWERRALFQLFQSFSEPYHGVCVRVDCTETYLYAKKHQLSMFLSLLHRSLAAAQRVDNFRTRIEDGEVWRYKHIHSGSAVGRENGTIGFAHYRYNEDLHTFVSEASVQIERVQGRTDLERYPGVDLIRYSVLPWFDFTSLSHARDFARGDSAPLITFGKITEAGGRRMMPVSIHVHHALVDGLHVAQFLDHFQNLLDIPGENSAQV